MNGVRAGGFVVVSFMRSHAKAERSQQTRRPTRREAAGSFFLPYLHICTPWDSRPSLYRSREARESDDDERSPPRGGGIRGTVCSGCTDSRRRCQPAKRKSRLSELKDNGAFRAKRVFWRVSLRRIRARRRNDSFYGSTDDSVENIVFATKPDREL